MFLNRTNQTLSIALLITILASIPLANADPDEREGERRGPPPEAIDACANQSEGAACSFSGRRGEELNGTCLVPPRGEASLVCAPEGGPPNHRRPEGPDEE